MWAKLGIFLIGLTPALVAKVMGMIGFTMFTYLGMTTLINSAIDQSNLNYSHLNGVVHSLLNIAGLDQTLSILGSAILSRLGLMVLKRFKFTGGGTGLIP